MTAICAPMNGWTLPLGPRTEFPFAALRRPLASACEVQSEDTIDEKQRVLDVAEFDRLAAGVTGRSRPTALLKLDWDLLGKASILKFAANHRRKIRAIHEETSTTVWPFALRAPSTARDMPDGQQST